MEWPLDKLHSKKNKGKDFVYKPYKSKFPTWMGLEPYQKKEYHILPGFTLTREPCKTASFLQFPDPPVAHIANFSIFYR